MQFKFIDAPGIPGLAWCAQIRAGEEIIRVIHGSGVEVHDYWFFEGAWDGPFDGPGFTEATDCTGSGARLHNNGVEFVSPTHNYRGLVTQRTTKLVLISNSLPFLLTLAGDKPDINYTDYYDILLRTFKLGFVRNPRPLKMREGSNVTIHVCCNIYIRRNNIQKFPKPSPTPPVSYEDYRDRLVAMLGRLRENAIDPRRVRVYEPLVTLSRGYDSVACAALGASAGWKTAVTLVPADPMDADCEDDGTPVAKCLGLAIEKFDMHAWRRRTDAPEAEFVATAAGGVMVRFAGMEDRLQNTLLIMGAMGDVIWNPDSEGFQQNYTRLKDRDSVAMGHLSHWEFQLRVGIVTVFPAAFLAVHWGKIRQIMNSEEMHPWSIGGDYDRPIPRRIAEEMGVPREFFGQKKMAGAHVFTHRISSRMGHHQYIKFLVKTGLLDADKNGKFSINLEYITPHFFHWGIRLTMRRYVENVPEELMH